MDVRLLYPSKYLGAVDLHGQDATLTMRRVVVEELETTAGKKKKPILYFEETRKKAEQNGAEEKRLVMNKTNAMTIASLYGNEVDQWPGKRITLFGTPVESFGKMVDAIRVRQSIPANGGA
jgi:hypothetical protein